MTSVIATSDLHQHFDFVLPKADIAIIAGDWSYRGRLDEQNAYAAWLILQRQTHPEMSIVWTNGNHELDCEVNREISERIAEYTDTFYLEDDGIELCGLKIWGSPYTPAFGNWAYMYQRGTDRWKIIPEGLDILITHGPPYGIGDRVFNYRGDIQLVGCYDLREEVKKKRPKHHIFGHIHCDYGCQGWNGSTEFYNVARCDEYYGAVNEPIFIPDAHKPSGLSMPSNDDS
jgi:Icc-related predicted phosphoesterase